MICVESAGEPIEPRPVDHPLTPEVGEIHVPWSPAYERCVRCGRHGALVQSPRHGFVCRRCRT